MLLNVIRSFLREIPSTSRAAAARRLIRRANAARDGRQFLLAAALYEEALSLNPANPRSRIQYAHMLKDSGDLSAAEQQYERAHADLPRDADLALQIGHLHKLAGRPERAEESYRRALALSPGWREAEREIAAVGGLVSEDPAQHGPDQSDWIVTELLPRGDGAVPPADRNILRLFRLGGRRTRSRWGDLKLLRGIEAIRGYRLCGTELNEVRLLIDGMVAHVEPLAAHPVIGAEPPQTKYVFNIWYDFSQVEPGRHAIELDFIDPAGKRFRRHRETILVAPPLQGDGLPGSDAFIPSPATASALEDAINARPSVVRSTERRLLPDPIRTILVQRVDQLGDLACSVPAIRRLRALFPGARMVGLVTPANAALAERLGLFDDVVTVDFAESAAERRRTLSVVQQDALRRVLAPYAFDIAIDLGEGDESRPLLLLSGAGFLYGFKDRLFPWLDAGLEFNGHDPVNGIEIIPPSRKLVLLVEGLGVMVHGAAAAAPLADRDGLQALGIDADDRYIVIHAGARLAYTRWPHVDALVRMLLAETSLKIVLFADDPILVEKIAGTKPPEGRLIPVAGKIDFATFDALLAHCAVFVGNDSGPKHLAALRGAPVVSLHMARLNWSEWGQEISGSIISRRVPCAGCGIGLDGEDCGKDHACLRHITPQEVVAAMHQYL